MSNPYRIGFPEDFIRFCFRWPMFSFAIVGNIAVTVLSPSQRGLWYTPLAIMILLATILFTYKHYGFKRRDQS